jgi:hypothetical protein
MQSRSRKRTLVRHGQIVMISDIRLRDAVPADSDFVFDVRRQAFRQYVELSDGWNEAQEQERHLERFGRQRFRVIVVAGVDVGYVATAVYPQATSNYPPSMYVHQLMVCPRSIPEGSVPLVLTCSRLRLRRWLCLFGCAFFA